MSNFINYKSDLFKKNLHALIKIVIYKPYLWPIAPLLLLFSPIIAGVKTLFDIIGRDSPISNKKATELAAKLDSMSKEALNSITTKVVEYFLPKNRHSKSSTILSQLLSNTVNLATKASDTHNMQPGETYFEKNLELNRAALKSFLLKPHNFGKKTHQLIIQLIDSVELKELKELNDKPTVVFNAPQSFFDAIEKEAKRIDAKKYLRHFNTGCKVKAERIRHTAALFKVNQTAENYILCVEPLAEPRIPNLSSTPKLTEAFSRICKI